MAVESPNSPLRTLVDGNMDVFRYGLSKNYQDSDYEDPTYLGFTIEIDTETSALFKQVGPFLERNGATRSELNARIPVYQDFVSKIVQIFKSQESVEEQGQEGIFIKQHYINSVSGLDTLSKKFIKWREDRLTIELHEDITMYSTYIANLYNNLVYSYENGRQMIPENLLKFNLKIKISEIRNLTSIAKLKSTNPTDQQIVDGLKNNITCLVYTLYDCEFDFFGARPFGNDIAQAGMDASAPGHSVLTFDMYFKSVARNMFNPLVKDALALNDNVVDLGVVIVGTNGNRSPNGQSTDNSATSIGINGEAYQELTIDGSASKRIFNFPNDIRKPSAISTYDIETENKPELKGNQDLSEVQNQKNELIEYNKVLAPDVTELKSTQFDPLAPDSDNTAIDKLIGKDLNNVIQDPTKALNNLTNKVASKVENTLKDQLNKAQTALQQKRNALVKNFINDLEAKAGLKRIIPDNLYYPNGDNYSNALDQLKSDVGLTIGDELIKTITGN